MCIFCKIINQETPSYNVYEDKDVIAFLDIAQVTKGHTLVLPKKHYDTLIDCPDDVVKKMVVVTKTLTKSITDRTGALGFNILNNGYEIAGQSIMHAHFHIIPRYGESDGFDPQFKENETKVNLEEVKTLITK